MKVTTTIFFYKLEISAGIEFQQEAEAALKISTVPKNLSKLRRRRAKSENSKKMEKGSPSSEKYIRSEKIKKFSEDSDLC